MTVLPRPLPPAAGGGEPTALSPQALHDLRSPLNLIIGYSEMLVEDADARTPELLIQDLGRIRSAGQRMLAFIESNFTALDTAAGVAADDEDEVSPRFTGPRQQAEVLPGRLLVVDDDPTNRDVLSRRLTRQGHEVTTISSGAEALQIMRTETFDLVLLDIMMPDMDGYEVLGRIKADDDLHHIPVVMISALSEVQSVVRCIEAGAEDYLAKPFNPTLLQARIGASLEKKRGRDRETALFGQLEKNYARLQELERVRDDMRNMIVHDLRTPLTSVIAGVDMVATLGPLNEAQIEMLGVAVSGGKTLLGLINDLLDIEKMEAGALQLQYDDLVPASLVTDAIRQLASLALEDQTVLVTELPPDLPALRGDGNKLTRILVNLIANAIKFSGPGTVTVAAAQEGPDMIRFSVRDSGEGIEAEAFTRIFEKFGQLDSRKVGTGFGLAFCKMAVEAHGGRIDVESVPGQGSTFSFTVPLVAPGETPQTP